MKSVIINRKNKISNRKLEKMKPVGTRLFQDLMERQFLLVRNYMYMGSMRVVLGVKKQKAGSFFGALELCSIIPREDRIQKLNIFIGIREKF